MNDREYFLVYKVRLALEVKLGNVQPRGTTETQINGTEGDLPMAHRARMDFCDEVLRPYGLRVNVLRALQLMAMSDQSLLNYLVRRLAHTSSQGAGEEAHDVALVDEQEAPARVVNVQQRENQRLRRAELSATRTANGADLDVRARPPNPDSEYLRELRRIQLAETEMVDASYVSKRKEAAKARRERGIGKAFKEKQEAPPKPVSKRRLLVGRKRPPVAEDQN